MSNQLKQLLSNWYESRTQQDWALATIYKTEGHSYRKSGAMVLVNEDGEQFGLLSGGCLEADIRKNARKAISFNQSVKKVYDGSDDHDISFQLGCGGIVHVLTQPLTKENNFLELESVYHSLLERKSGSYFLQIPENNEIGIARFECEEGVFEQAAQLISENGKHVLKIALQPEPHLLIAGGGVDAIPVCNLAKQMGWQVTVWDSRSGFASQQHFSEADNLLHCGPAEIEAHILEYTVNAVVAMTHNLNLDAAVLKVISSLELRYAALLGPIHRKREVMDIAGLSEQDFNYSLSGPAGFDIGGELPESIALSIISECHQKLYKEEKLELSVKQVV